MTNNNYKKWVCGTLLSLIIILLLIMGIMVFVDPYFHYHGPVDGLNYRLYSERYINRGIVKHFEYDAVITGTSMNQNFKTSQMDELFGTNAIKVTFSGAGFKEIADNLRVALSSDNEVKYVLWGIDYLGLYREYDWQGYSDYPEYLYDNNILNDVSYFFNKTILFEGLFNTLLMNFQGKETTTFDEYSSWGGETGWPAISKTYRRSEKILPKEELTEEERNIVAENIIENIVKVAQQYPDTEFLLFYTPYSALYWEDLYRDGILEKQLEIEKTTTELLLECQNIKLYSFVQETKLSDDLSKFRDKEHYMAETNMDIMNWIYEDKGRVTKENYLDIIEWEREHYMNYDYDKLYLGYEEYMEPKK